MHAHNQRQKHRRATSLIVTVRWFSLCLLKQGSFMEQDCGSFLNNCTCPQRRSRLRPQTATLNMSGMVLPAGYSLEVGHVFSPLLFLDSLQDLLLCLSAFPLIIFAVLFKKKKKPYRVHFSLWKKKKKESGKKFDLDPTHGSQPALPCSHRAMLKGFYKHSAKAAS